MTAGAQSFPEAFVRRAARAPNVALLRSVRFEKGQPHALPVSNADIFERSRMAAGRLQRLGVRAGDRVVLCLTDVVEFVAFFLGAQCIGAIAVPLPSTRELQIPAYVDRIAGVSRDAAPAAFVVDDTRAVEAIPEEVRRNAPVANVLDTNRSGDSSSSSARFEPERPPREIAFLQYTSGSTGSPKGVVVLHQNLIANIAAIVEGAGVDENDVVFSWLPLFHDMGLVAGLCLGLYVGIPTYVAPTRSFMTSPVAWLRAITKFHATFSAGPNFAYDVLARRVPDRTLTGIDLSSWRLAFDGAELVDPETVSAFVERYGALGFETHSLRPAYGLAEGTLAAAFPRPGMPVRFDWVDGLAMAERRVAVPCRADARGATVHASVGIAVPGHAIHIAGPDSLEPLPERHLGEVVFRGPAVTPGYFHELARGERPREALRTGDIGYLAEGQLFIVDRLKDILVLAGRKYAPSDIERAVATVPGIRPGAVVAFSQRRDAGTEELCVVAGIEPKAARNGPSLSQAIQRVLREQIGLTASDVILVRPAALPRTSSGKLRRSACAAIFGKREPPPRMEVGDEQSV